MIGRQAATEYSWHSQTRRILEKFELYNKDWSLEEGALILRNWTAVPD